MFPVMPGVLMLEAMYQASAWLLRATDDFANSMVLLKEAKNVKYSGFVKPGETLEVESELQQRSDSESWFKAVGRRDGEIVVRAKLGLESFNLDSEVEGNAAVNQRLIVELKKEFEILYPSLGMKKVVG